MKFCPRCLETKPVSQYFRRKTSKDGLNTYCKSCQSAATSASRAKNPRIGDLSDDEVLQSINRFAEPASNGEWHWRYEGRTGNTAKNAKPALQRISLIIDGRSLPLPIERWCEEEFPGCVNPDHVVEHGSLPTVTHEELMGTEESGTYGKGTFSMIGTLPDPDKSRADLLRELETIPFEFSEKLERMATEFLASHGYGAYGQPLKRRRPKDLKALSEQSLLATA